MTDAELQNWREFLDCNQILLPEGGADDCSDQVIERFAEAVQATSFLCDMVASGFPFMTDVCVTRSHRHTNMGQRSKYKTPAGRITTPQPMLIDRYEQWSIRKITPPAPSPTLDAGQ